MEPPLDRKRESRRFKGLRLTVPSSLLLADMMLLPHPILLIPNIAQLPAFEGKRRQESSSPDMGTTLLEYKVCLGGNN
jgi:hypothetical protein